MTNTVSRNSYRYTKRIRIEMLKYNLIYQKLKLSVSQERLSRNCG